MSLDANIDHRARADEGEGEGEPVYDGVDLHQVAMILRQGWRSWLLITVLAGVAGGGGSFLVKPEFTSNAVFIPPQQQQSAAAASIASLGALAGLAGVGPSKSPGEEYISLMQSVTVSDRMIDRFKLMSVYDQRYRATTRKKLAEHAQITLGKKDGLITVAVSDEDPKRAAEMANQFVDELRIMTSTLAVSEAQQRRVFFERQMQETKSRLVAAQTTLQTTGFNADAIKTQPSAEAEQYARLRADAVGAEVKLQTMRASMADSSPEVLTQSALLASLRTQLERLAGGKQSNNGTASDYVNKYREFKYQESLFEMMSKQYELARVDESREGALIQVVDVAQAAEYKSKPKRSLMAGGAAFLGFIFGAVWLLYRHKKRSR